MSVCLPVYLCFCLSVCLPICLSIYLSVSLSVCLSFFSVRMSTLISETIILTATKIAANLCYKCTQKNVALEFRHASFRLCNSIKIQFRA